MSKLSSAEIENIISLLKEGKPLPEEYKTILFDTNLAGRPTGKEYELVYADKKREVDILSDTMAVPLQPVKTFRNGLTASQASKNGNDWSNMLIFGDNLQVLKTLSQLKQEGKLKNADGTPGVRLVYIDPPFATKQEFRGSQDQKAYQDKIAGARFLEFLRERLVFLRELLSEDGSVYVHLDWKKGHYVKTIMDEVFGENKFRNEIAWKTQTPMVECKYSLDYRKGQLDLGKGSRDCVIRIEEFESRVISRKPLDFANLETLSMVMLDYDFDGEVFDLDEVFYAEELKKNNYELRFAEDKVKDKIMIIYIDIFGNEKREIKSLKDFKKGIS